MEVIADRLALPGSLGRICPRLCERQCRRCELDQGLAIGALHRYVADCSTRRIMPPRAPATGKSVAIVGAGPAGLAAAYFSLRKGHDCTLFDAHPLPGGMLRYGIPAIRLPKDALDAEIEAMRGLGARFRMGQRWGEQFTLAGLARASTTPCSWPSARSAHRGSRCAGEEHALARHRVPGTRGRRAIRHRWATTSWWSEAAIRPWIAPAPRSGWARGTCACSIAAAGRKCPA